METTRIYPLTFTPILRDYIWGGRRLETLYGRTLPPGITAESWEISGHPSAPTYVDAGSWRGLSLPEVLASLGPELVGTNAAWATERRKFPLLVKLLDAHSHLSVQVHPDDEFAAAHADGELGKTEMWYVLHADPGAEIVYGVKSGLSREELRQGIAQGDVEALVRRIPVRAGDAIYIPAGTLHALLAGVVVTEIQQNSDTTYRVFDWGRVGADGRPRPLHVDQALEVIDFSGAAQDVIVPRLLASSDAMTRSELVRDRYFVTESVDFAPHAAFDGACNGETLEIWGCISGEVAVEWAGDSVPLRAIRYALLPAALGAFRIRSSSGARCLRVTLPPPADSAAIG